MGSCICIKDKQFSIHNNSNGNQNFTKVIKLKKFSPMPEKSNKINTNYFYKISKKNWLRIVNFLNYKDLKEASKVCR